VGGLWSTNIPYPGHCTILSRYACSIETLILPEFARFGKAEGNEVVRLVVLLVVQILCLESKDARLALSVQLLTRTCDFVYRSYLFVFDRMQVTID
jgi:hypothetical protein